MTAEAPYPGLRPFDFCEADVFFGREEETDRLLAKLAKNRFLAVVGPSGCGKSSLVRAGLISNISAGFMASAGARWRIASMRPGRDPMRRLAVALLDESALGPERADGPDEVGLLGATLWRGPFGLVEALGETPLPPDTNLLLLVDQFEEIFRFRSEEERDEAGAFVALMVASAEQQEFPIYVVITMRSDHIGDCGLFTGLPERVSESQFLTPHLSREQREAAITGPARVFGGDVDQALVSRLLNETSGDPERLEHGIRRRVSRLLNEPSSDPNHLPVLQHLLMRMWNRALHERERKGAESHAFEADDHPILTLENYKAVGGLKSALSNHANEAYDRLTGDQKRLAEVMFRRLCELDLGHLYTGRHTSVQEIAEVAGVAPERVIEVADVFRDSDINFLVPGHLDPFCDAAYMEISHESLICQWDRLKEWAKDEAKSAETYLRLSDAAELWQQGRATLWNTLDLAIALKWQQEQQPNEAWAQRYGGDFDLAMQFLSASKEARDTELAEKEAAQRQNIENLRKLAEEQEQRANDKEAAAKKYWRMAVAAGVLFVFATIMGGLMQVH